MKKLKYLVLILMILVFLSGLGVLLYPYIRGYLVDRQIERTAEEFLSRVETDPISPYPSESQLDQDTPSDSPEPTEPDTYTDLWRDMVDYNKEIYINGQKGLDCKLAYEDPSFVLADYGLESEVFAVISIPALELEMPVFLGANYRHMADGAALLGQTSIPIGGKNTNCIIAGHRGWGGASYFRYVDKLQPGDEVIIPEPCFVCYEPITTLSGGVPVHVACRQEDEFRLKADALKAAITPRTKLVIMPFPNNPTGAVMEREDLEAVAEVLRDTNVMVLSDEIYAELNYGLRPHVSIASLPGMAERTIVVNGFSKSYAMTGWRLGYACGPEPIIKIMTKIHQSAIMSAPTTSQYAAITALRDCDGEIDRMRDEYNMRRRLVVRSFNDMGLTCFEPRGAFYAFPCIKSTGLTSQEFCTRLLEEKHVAIIPGDAFGASGEGYCRVSYAYSVEHLTEALKRIREFLQENGLVQGN